MNIFIIFAVLARLVSVDASENVKCNYMENIAFDFSLPVNFGLNNYFQPYEYACAINNLHSGIPIGIEGQHKPGKTDDDVQFLTNIKNHILTTFTSIFCEKFKNLEAITLEQLHMESLEEDSLIQCSKLKFLRLYGNLFHQLPEKLLLGNPALIVIFIATNHQLTTLPVNFFENQKNLSFLCLYSNSINYLPNALFRPAPNIDSLLLLDGNNFTVIDPKLFEDSQKVVALSLSRNFITEIPSKCFKNLKKLKYFEIYINKIHTLHVDSFEGLVSLERLDLASNNLDELPGKVFKNLKNLQILHVAINRIDTLHSDTFEGLDSLIQLGLYKNQLTDLPPSVFSPLNELKELHLDQNKLLTIHSDSFAIHLNLNKLDLSNNMIKSLDEKLIQKIPFAEVPMMNNFCCSTNLTFENKYYEAAKCYENYQPRSEVGKCGQQKIARSMIYGGQYVNRSTGIFPWHAVLRKKIDNKFFCGGVLISNKKVITAAHCLLEKNMVEPKTAEDLEVLLGVYDLDKTSEEGRSVQAINKIKIHPEWDPMSPKYDADIAVLILKDNVKFGISIGQVCLMFPKSAVADITTGTVVGYGESEDRTKKHEKIPKFLAMPIHNDHLICYKKDKHLAEYSSNRTVCVGSADGKSGTCSGDSGSGIYVEYKGSYYLRGIVSSSMVNVTTGLCDLKTYSIATDMLYFYDFVSKDDF